MPDPLTCVCCGYPSPATGRFRKDRIHAGCFRRLPDDVRVRLEWAWRDGDEDDRRTALQAAKDTYTPPTRRRRF